jgi:hypothetical protein
MVAGVLWFTESLQTFLAHASWIRGRSVFVHFALMLPPWMILAMLLPGVYFLVRWQPIRRPHWAGPLALHAAAAGVFPVIHFAALTTWHRILYGPQVPFGITLFGLLGRYYVVDVIMYWAAAGTIHALLWARRPEGVEDRVLVRSQGRTEIVPIDELVWIEAADYCVRLHTRERTLVHRETLRSLERRLDPVRFRRVHRSAVVNLDFVRSVRNGPGGEWVLTLETGAVVPVSRRSHSQLSGVLQGVPTG